MGSYIMQNNQKICNQRVLKFVFLLLLDKDIKNHDKVKC